MKITRVSIYALRMPLHRPYKVSRGRLLFTELDSTFVALETDTGLIGWGEGCPWGHSYLPAHGAGIRAAAELLAPAVLGMDPRRLDRINHEMDLTLPGHLYAKAPFDVACWDLFGQATGMPLVELLGGRHDEPTPIASNISADTPAAMLQEINEFRARGYHTHSCTVGTDVREDIERVRRLAAAEQPGEFIVFDVNRAWTPLEAIQVMNAVGGSPAVFEQPCATLDQCAAVRARTTQAISIDERLETLDDLRHIIDRQIGEIINLKINRVGGLTRARRLRDLALASGIKMLLMDTGGSVLADTAVQHLAQSIPRDMRLGSWLCQELVGPDPAPEQGSRNVGGMAVAPNLPGLGVTPDLAVLGRPFAVYGA